VTVQQLKTRSPTYVADGVETEFPTDFEFLEAADIVVYVDGAEVVGYSVTGGQGEEGTVVFDAPIPDQSSVDVLRKTALTQLIYTAALATPATLERTLDRIIRILQSQARVDAQAVRVPPYELAGIELPPIAERASKYLAFDAMGDGVAFTDAPTSELLSEKITLVDTQFDYPLPVSIQSTADEDNYAVTLVNGGELIRGAAYDFTVASNVLTLNTTPTVANGLAGEEILVELIRPGIDGTSVQPGSIGSSEIALLGVESKNLLFTGQSNGDILWRIGGEWVPVAAPTTDGKYYPRMTVSSAGTVWALTWEQGGLLNNWQFPATNTTVATISGTLPDNDIQMTITDGDEILTRTFTLGPDVAGIKILCSINIACNTGQTVRAGLFRNGVTNSLKETRWKEHDTGSMQTLIIPYSATLTASEERTYSVRVTCTDATGRLNQDYPSSGRKSGGSIGHTMFIEVLGSKS
jgi:hypothetical protein